MSCKNQKPAGAAKRAWRGASLWTLGVAITAVAQSPAMAQQAPLPENAAVGGDEKVYEAIVVTASRIDRLGFEAPTPTTVLGQEEIARTSATNVGEILNEVPAFLAAQTPTAGTLSNNAGANYLDLRGLGQGIGVPRTLVLVNNRRHVATTSGGVLDTNVIPSVLIDRIEVVTGGASAAWGSDAVAGVVNFIFDNDFEGVRGTLQSGISGQGDYEEWKTGLAFGTSFGGDRGHFVIAGEAVDNEGILNQSARDWGAEEWGLVDNADYVPGTGSFQRIPARNAHLSIATEGGLILSGSLAGTQFGPGGTPTPFQYGTNTGLFMEGGDGVNMGRYTALAVPLKRAAGFSRASYDLTPDLTGFVELSAARTESHNPNIIQSFDFGTTFVQADNAFLPDAISDLLATSGEAGFALGRVNTDIGFIEAYDESETLRGVAGVDGRFGAGWTWNAYYQYGRNTRDNRFLNNLIMPNYLRAGDAVVDPATGSVVCRSTLTNPDDGCIPLNLFGFGSPSAAAIDYVTGDQRERTRIEQHVIAASVQGEPFSTWAGPVGFVAGAEQRSESVVAVVDPLSAADAFLVGNPKSVDGDYDVREVFGEVIVPLAMELPFAQSLDFNAAARVTDYSTTGSVATWKAGLSWEPLTDIRFRAARSRDIRAPNIAELFRTSTLSFSNVLDPVTGDIVLVPSPNIPNPNLAPEEADTWTIGMVVEPQLIPGLRLAVDFYDIDLKGVIATLSPQDIVTRCAEGASDLCTFVRRDPGGALVQVDRANVNLARLWTRGVDFDATYDTDFGPGSLALRLLATYVDTFTFDDGVSEVDRAGDVGVRGGVPHWRGRLTATYEQGPATVYLAGRYVDGGKFDSSLPAEAVGPNDYSARLYLDTSIEYALIDRDDMQVRLFGSIENLLDKDPPIMPADFIAPLATNPILYDVIGRQFNFGVRFRF